MAWSTDPAVKQSNGGSRGAAAPAGNPSNGNNSNAAAGGNLGPFNDWPAEDQPMMAILGRSLKLGHNMGLYNELFAGEQAIPEQSLPRGHDMGLGLYNNELFAEEQAIPEQSLPRGHDMGLYNNELFAEEQAIPEQSLPRGHDTGIFNDWFAEEQAIPKQSLPRGHDMGLYNNELFAEEQAIPEQSIALGHDTDELSAENQAILEESLPPGHDTDQLSAEELAIIEAQARRHEEWSAEEQAILEEGLAKYASEQTFVSYSKIAKQLSKKKIRDVAMRCSWMTKMESEKRRKEDLARKSKEKKDRVTDPSPKPPAHLAARPSAPPYGLSMLHIDNNEDISYKGLRIKKKKISPTKDRCPSLRFAYDMITQIKEGIGGVTGQLLGHNTQIQDNLILFCHARDNLLKILNDMNDEPEIMKQMLPLLEKLNEELTNFILTRTIMPSQTRRRKRPHADSSAA